MKPMHAYIAGPMSGIPKFNFPAFDAVAAGLRQHAGVLVTSPHELDDPDTREWAESSETGDPEGRWGSFLGRDLELIRNGGIDSMVLLPDWHVSQGARLEVALALDCGHDFYAITPLGGCATAQSITLDGFRCDPIERESVKKLLSWTSGEIAGMPVKTDESLKPNEIRFEFDTAAVPTTDPPPGHEFTTSSPDVTKPTNPKDLVGSSKLPLHLWPTTATIWGSLALLDGASKYGRSNWRAAGVRYSIYMDAAIRHLFAAFEGEDADPDSGLPHEAHALACLGIIVDARAAGKLTDDRAFNGGHYRELVKQATEFVDKIKAAHAERDPKHYTIADPLEGDPEPEDDLVWIMYRSVGGPAKDFRSSFNDPVNIGPAERAARNAVGIDEDGMRPA